MTAHSRRRKVTKRAKAKQGPLHEYIFNTTVGIVDTVAAHSVTEAKTIFKAKHGFSATPKEKDTND